MSHSIDSLHDEEVSDLEEPLEEAVADADTSEDVADSSFASMDELADVTQIYLNDIGHNALLSADEEKALCRRVVQGDFAARQRMIEHRTQQMLAALAHHLRDVRGLYGGQPQVVQHGAQRLGEVAQGVHHGAVQVDDGRVQALQDRRRHARARRMASMTAL